MKNRDFRHILHLFCAFLDAQTCEFNEIKTGFALAMLETPLFVFKMTLLKKTRRANNFFVSRDVVFASYFVGLDT